MLGSQEEDSSPQDNDNSRHYHHHGHRIIQTFSNTPPSIHMRQLLSSCAELISRSDLSAAHRLTTILSTNSSQFGDSTERLVHQFTKALSLRLHRLAATITTTTTITTAATTAAFFLPISPTTTRPISNYFTPSSSANIPFSIYNQSDQYDDSVIQSSYLSLNQITPFIRFTHLTANQAILEAIDNHNTIHILDFDVMHGVQWPPLMQALAERYPPPSLQISGTGNNIDVLQRTGDRLEKFAHSLNLQFQFHPIFLPNINNSISSLTTFHLNLPPNESLAINCMSYLHRFNNQNLMIFLHKIRSMNPKVLTISEPEADHNHPLFLQRFGACVEYYTAVFDSLEATLPPNSRERLSVEQVWFGREISDIVAAEGENRRERHQRFRAWDLMLRTSGFVNVPLSPFALSQAKLLLRLHYPSEGYQIEAINDSFFLGWQNQHLFSVSSWH